MGDTRVFRYGSFKIVRISTKDAPLLIEIQFSSERGNPYELRFTKEEVKRITQKLTQQKKRG